MKVLLVRHAEAENPRSDHPDDWRELTPAGRRQVRKLGKRLGELGESWDGIVVSPLVRAIQTAEIMACGLSFKEPVRISGALVPGSGTWQAYLEACRMFEGARTVALVGHDPDLSAIASDRLGRPFSLRKGAILAFKVDSEGRTRDARYFAPDGRDWTEPPLA